MSQEPTQTSEAQATAQPGFQRDPNDGPIDVNNLPPIPWTREELGVELFKQLATVAGVGDLQDHQRNPSLDPRSFGMSRAKRLIRLNNVKGHAAQAYLDEGRRLQAAIDAQLPAIRGKQRKAGAPSLRPARTTRRTNGPGPNQWS